jgi:hypothetical protein
MEMATNALFEWDSDYHLVGCLLDLCSEVLDTV